MAWRQSLPPLQRINVCWTGFEITDNDTAHFNFSLLSDALVQIHSDSLGTYAVHYRTVDRSGNMAEAIRYVTVVNCPIGLQDPEGDYTFNLFPNPSNGLISFHIPLLSQKERLPFFPFPDNKYTILTLQELWIRSTWEICPKVFTLFCWRGIRFLWQSIYQEGIIRPIPSSLAKAPPPL